MELKSSKLGQKVFNRRIILNKEIGPKKVKCLIVNNVSFLMSNSHSILNPCRY